MFTAAHIPYLIFKGTEISYYYPNSELRQIGDIDILVHEEDKERAAETLCRMGFSTDAEQHASDHEWIFFKYDLEAELHNRLLYSADFNEEKHTAFTDRVWEYATTEDGTIYHLEPEFHFVFLILHLRKHFLWAGVGIRQFMDLAVMMKNADLDWVKVEAYLSEIGILQFAKTCFALIYRWFDISSPITAALITDDFYLSATETILSDGVFGWMNKESLINNEIMNATRKHGRIMTAMAVIFPPFEQMREKYPQMGRWFILLPLMWVRRMVESVIYKRVRSSMSYATKPLAMDKEMKKRNKMLKSWGL